jgi:hypothetical protein
MAIETNTKIKACANCAFWDASNESEGSCRRSAPQTVVFEISSKQSVKTVFPVTSADDWCGEFQAK